MGYIENVDSKALYLSSTMSMIALYVNEQIGAITRQRLPERIKQMTQIYAPFKKCTLNTDIDRGENKSWGKEDIQYEL